MTLDIKLPSYSLSTIVHKLCNSGKRKKGKSDVNEDLTSERAQKKQTFGRQK